VIEALGSHQSRQEVALSVGHDCFASDIRFAAPPNLSVHERIKGLTPLSKRNQLKRGECGSKSTNDSGELCLIVRRSLDSSCGQKYPINHLSHDQRHAGHVGLLLA